jgi:hypothetical protein
MKKIEVDTELSSQQLDAVLAQSDGFSPCHLENAQAAVAKLRG